MWFCFVLLCLFVHTVVTFGPQPRIISQDGNLIFKPGDNKNIQFLTNGKGKIFLNDGELSSAASLARNASKTLERINNDYFTMRFQIQKCERVIEGPTGVLNRLNVLESGMHNSTNGTSARPFFNAMDRRFRLLRRRVNRLFRLLTKNECANAPCKNGGTCQDLFNGFVCQCPDEWEGPTCDKDVNECARFAGTDLGCQNGATCVNKPGSYECLCDRGWFGIHCTRQTVSCTTGSVVELCGHGTCIQQNNGFGYKCLCDQGWTTDGTNPPCTVDVDECKLSVPSCSKNPVVECENTPGSFKCGNCPAGFTGNGYYCNDIDECAIFNGGCSVTPMVRCINTPGSRVCGACPPGYVGDGTSCSFRGVCGINNGGCHHLAQCRDNPSISSTYVECICPAGYLGTGIGANGCIPSSPGGNACAINPCVHGTCIPDNTTGSYICQCRRKFTGRNCDIRKDPCQPNPCAHGGTCQSIMDLSFTCTCTSDYTGNTCGTLKQACGGFLKGYSGSIKYPQSHGHVYESTVSCAWIVQTNATKVLNVTFTHLNLQPSSNCRYDWLQIHDGSNTAAQSFGRFCGTSLPNGGNIISTHNRLYIWLRIDSSIKNPGFEMSWDSTDPVCGGSTYVVSHGTLRSPGHPGNYPLNRDCYWSLNAPLGKRLNFHFYTLMIGNSGDCSGDYLTFYQGASTSDRVLAKYCNTSYPEPLYSVGPELLIHFHSDATASFPGFQISYSVIEGVPGCGGVYTANSGEISSPLENGRYPTDLICEYKIQVSQQSRIKITFLTFDLEDDPSCYDSLSIHEGGSSTAPLVNKYCGSKLPPSYTSIGNQIFLVFVSDWGNTDSTELGFRLRYETLCGGIYSEATGVIESPGFPNPYREDQVCIYEIIQPLGRSITLTFTDFEMEAVSYSECIFDYLEVRDGDNENSTLIGKYCDSSPPIIQSTYNYLWIKFESDSSVGASGFRANFSTIDIGCGGILKSQSGIIKSTTVSDTYISESTCMWVIVAPTGFSIQLTWILFRLEEGTACAFDYVEIYNNHTVNELIGKYCGHKLPPNLISTSNILTIKFVSDMSITYEGFIVSYQFVDQESACGGRYFSSTGVIKSPFYPKEYPPSRDCVWIITVNSGEQMLLNITDFQIEDSEDCVYDYLELRNGGTTSSPLIGKYCGSKIPTEIPSHSNQMYLLFHSDTSHENVGFKLTWESTATGCGGTLTTPKGTITSPFYPEAYSEDTDCTWTITVNAGSVIQIAFVDLELENHDECLLDFVEIFDGPNLNSKSLGRFCINANAPFIKSTTNIMVVLFRADSSIQARGFHLQYITLCVNTLRGNRGVIESPNFPHNYPFSVDCTWTVEVAIGNYINITFAEFELVSALSSTACSVNFLQIKYRSDVGDMLDYGTYCGVKRPTVMTINSNVAEIHFVSNASLLSNGFLLEWQIEGCGGILNKASGTISTPNYPKPYPEPIECNWVIQMEYGKSIQITFEEVDFEVSSDCVFDYILVTNGVDDTYPTLTKICSKGTKPITLTSTGNAMFVRFKSDYSNHGKGFWANYTSVDTKCGGKMTTFSGSVHSPNYPQNYDQMDLCEWLIEVENNHVIDLTFVDVDLVDDCNTHFIKVYDGPSAGFPLLHKICKNDKPPPLKSTRNYMTIELQTGSAYTAKGFRANYTLGCGARIETQNSGLINLHDGSLSAIALENCSWTIVNKIPSQHVTLIVTHLDSFQCIGKDNVLKVYNGESKESPLIAEYCEKLPPPIISTGNALHVELTNIAISFVAKYNMIDSECGGTFSSESGVIATPGYPNSYPMGIQCEWTLQVAEGNRLTISFGDFDLMSSENCHLDYVEIREENNRGKIIGTFCDVAPTTIERIGTVWILFKSSRPIGEGAPGKGFMAEYTLAHGVNLEGLSGKIASPLYPKYVYRTETFQWTITVTFGKAIMISFIDFYIESYNDDECFNSKLEMYDGYDDEAALLTSLCGVTTPQPIKSTSNVIGIKIFYDSVHHGSRFLLEWIEIDIATEWLPGTKTTVNGCGSQDIIEISNTTVYNLTSPGFPFGYDNNLECEWIFSTTPLFHLVIAFTEVDLETYGGVCGTDIVKIYNKAVTENGWKLVTDVCHPNFTLVHGSNLVKVVFQSDGYGNRTGFSARIRQICGGNLYDSDGIITTNANEFRHMMVCEWNVTVRPGHTIEVNILELNVEDKSTDGSCKSYLMLKNGHYPDSPILGIGKYCTNVIPLPLNTTGNYLYVKYFGFLGKNLELGLRPGLMAYLTNLQTFTLSYKEKSQNCGGSLVLTQRVNETIISSPNYPNIPPPFTECYWTVRTTPGQSLRVDFIERFDLTISSNCTEAAVEVRDGGSQFSPLIGKFCRSIPSSVFTTDNMVNIRFFTNLKDPDNGFKAKITIASCGGVIRGKSGEVRSPNFNVKSKYPKNALCVWHLIGSPDHSLIMKFKIIDLGTWNSEDCLTVDHVSLEENVKFNDSMRDVGVYCGNLNPGEIQSSTNEVIVTFRTGSEGGNLAGFSLSFNSSRESCGGVLNTESGEIESPGYPLASYHDIECDWIIEVPEGRRVKLEFDDLDLEINGFNQGILFYEDKKYQFFIKYGQKTFNSSFPVKSSGNMLHVLFWSSKATTHRGFKAHYSSNEPSICVGDFSKTAGVIRNLNETSYYCKWKHLGTTSETLALTITTSLDSPRDQLGSCKQIPTALLVTSDNENRDIAIFCGAVKKPTIVRSPYGITKLIGYQRLNKSFKYTVNYLVHSCGGIITKQDGFITSPSFPQKHSGTVECAWVLKLPENQKINVNFVTVDLDKNCEYNYIIIYNGEFPTSPKIGHFCENNKPTTLNVQQNVLLIEYHSDERGTGTGFKMQFQPIIGGCGGIFHDQTRIIETPSYPKDYPNNAECTWEILGQNGYLLRLDFIDRFYIEESKDCANDFIEIWNYVDEWVSLGRKCGKETPQYVNSTSNRLKIVFRSNDKITASGFKAKWTSHCGGIFEATSQNNYIVSPGYPNDYGGGLTCQYTITTSGHHVNIVFEDFVLEDDRNCKFDNLTINTDLDVFDTNFERPLVYCGKNKPRPLRRSSNTTVTFRTDPWISRRGFKILYRFDDCGGVVDKPKTIMSPRPVDPNSNNNYENSLNCYWNITAPPDRSINVNFIKFDLEHNSQCYYDFVELFEGLSTNTSQRLALLCGNLTTHLPMVKSTGNTMTIHFQTDFTNNYYGFEAVVFFPYGKKAGCGDVVNVETSKVVEAPFGFLYYDCQWEIITAKDHILRITFTELHLGSCPSNVTTADKNCSCNSVTIKDGGPFSETIETVCDTTIPPPITTTGNTAWLRLFVLGSTPDRAFKATFTKVPSVCGPSVLNVTNQTNVLTSPGYPNSYPNNIICKWTLRSENEMDRFDMRFIDFDLLEASASEFYTGKCTRDNVQIIDKQYHHIITEGLGEDTIFSGGYNPTLYNGHSSPVGIHEYCGKQALAFDHYSGENKVIVKFTSGFNVPHGKGFKLEYRLAGCNRNFTSPQGRYYLGNMYENCVITITVPENYTVSLYFNTFTMYDMDECSNVGLEIYDGDSKSAKKLARLCGYTIPDPIFATGNKLLLSSWKMGEGYDGNMDITYTTSKAKGCGGIFYNYAGKFTSPLYPKGFRERSTCQWDITVPQGMNVFLTFSVFDINGARLAVTTYNKDGSEGTVHRYNGTEKPSVIKSETNRLIVEYVTTLNSGGSGWVANFLAGTTDTRFDSSV